MWNRTITALVWALVGWGAVALGLRLWPGQLDAPSYTRSVPDAVPEPGPLVRVLGAAPAQAATLTAALADDLPWRLVGVVAAQPAATRERQGVALLAREGRPVRSVRVGQRLDETWAVRAVEPRAVLLGPVQVGSAAATRRLELPASAAPSPSLTAPPVPSNTMSPASPTSPTTPTNATMPPAPTAQAAGQGDALRGERLLRAAH